jgi:hypothetical protein
MEGLTVELANGTIINVPVEPGKKPEIPYDLLLE